MRYVYEGVCLIKSSSSTELKAAKRLLGASHYFQLDGLKRKCEIHLSKNLSIDNCVSVYKAAKVSVWCQRIGLFISYHFFLLNLKKTIESLINDRHFSVGEKCLILILQHEWKYKAYDEGCRKE